MAETEVAEQFAQDYAKVAHVMATLSITIFLTLCLLVGEKYSGFGEINGALWIAVGLFGASSLRFMDCLFDANSVGKDHLFVLLEKNGKFLFALDYRFTKFEFATYFSGWLFFLVAYYRLGALVFEIPTSPFSLWAVISHSWYTIGVTLLITVATLLASTHQIFYYE